MFRPFIFLTLRLGPLLLNLLAPFHMVRVRSSLTLDTAVPIDMAASTSLGWDANVIGTHRIGAGFRLVVAGTALNQACTLAITPE